MRIRRILLRSAVVIAGAVAVVFVGLQTGPGQRALFDMAGSLASAPGRTIRLEGPSGLFPTDLRLARVEMADAKGTWLAADDVQLSWSFLPLLGGKLDVQAVRAARLAVTRPPEPTAEPAPPTAATSGSSSGGLPVQVSLGALVIDELQLGAALTGVESRWRIDGAARLEGAQGANSVTLTAARTDGREGRLALRANYDAARGVASVNGDVIEGEGGVLAALLGRPDLPRTTGKIKAEGSGESGDVELAVEAGDALRLNGSGRLRPDPAGRHVALSLRIEGGHMPNPAWAAALARPATVDADVLLQSAGAIDIRTLRVVTAPLEATASGRYVPDDKRLVDMRLTATGGDPAMLATILPGAAWRDLRLEMSANGTLAALDATVSLRAAALTMAPTATATDVSFTGSTQGADLSGPALRVQLDGTVGALTAALEGGKRAAVNDMRLALRAERSAAGVITISGLDLASSLGHVTATGRLAADSSLDATATLEVPDLKVLAAITGQALGGATQLTARVSGKLDAPAVTVDATLRDAVVPNVPPGLLTPSTRLTANAALDRQGSWRLDKMTIASEALSIEGSGQGRGAAGTADVTIVLPKLEAVDPRYTGNLRSNIRIDATGERRTVQFKAQLAQGRLDGTAIERLDLDANLALRQDGVDATLTLDGNSGEHPLHASGRIAATAGERLSIPTFEATLGKLSLSVKDLVVDRTSATGSARLLVEDLGEVGALVGQKLAGKLEVTVAPDPGATDGKLKIALRGSNLASGNLGVGTLTGDATVVDPLGRAGFEAKVAASALRGIAEISSVNLKASGDRTEIAATTDVSGPGVQASAAIKARLDGGETTLDIESLKAARNGRTLALTKAAQIRLANGRTTIEPMQLAAVGGQIRIAGVVDAASSDLQIDLTGLPLAELAALGGAELQLAGALQGQVRLRGASANPDIDVTYAVRDARLRSLALASVPAVTLTGKGALRNRQATADAQLAAGGSNLALNVAAQLPQGGAPDLRLTVKGPVDLAMLASVLGPDIQQVGGRAIFDAVIASRGGRPSGTGTVRLEGLNLALPAQGLVLSKGTGLIRLADDRIVIEQFTFPAVGKGDISASGDVRLDPNFTLPVNLRIETRRARLMGRRDLLAELTSSLQFSGSVAEGLKISGPIRIDRAEINVAMGGASTAVPAVPVREIGAGAPKQATTSAPAKPMALDIKISAPQAIFVRGKGLDAEVQGDLAVAGTSDKPSVTGGLQLRRGTFQILGRTLNFTRGVVSFVSGDRIEPLLDMLAVSRNGNVTINIAVTGSASDPKIKLSSTPTLPQDEILAQFLFGRGAAELGPSQLAQVAEAVAQLAGGGSGGGVVDSMRQALGLDRLGIGTGGQDSNSKSSSGVGSATVEGGRYIAPGVYLGGRQGLQGDSRGVVQIEVIPHVKIEAEVGTKSTGRAGVALEYDY